jgi:hypothetical protein
VGRPDLDGRFGERGAVLVDVVLQLRPEAPKGVGGRPQSCGEGASVVVAVVVAVRAVRGGSRSFVTVNKCTVNLLTERRRTATNAIMTAWQWGSCM